MKGLIVRFTQNVDALVPLLLGVAMGVLGLLDVVSPKIVDNSILITLAVLSFALLRDRWTRDGAEASSASTSEATRALLAELQVKLERIAVLDQLIVSMQATVEGLSTIKTLRGPDKDHAFAAARVHTDRWMFKGGTGTYTRAVTLPQCVEIARRERRALMVRLEILDPTDEVLCEKYTRFRTSLSTRPDGTGEYWTTDRTRKESYATVLAACWYLQRFQLLDISVGLSSTMSTFRYDMSADRLLITQDDPQFPAILISNASPLYDGYATELRTSLAQVRRVPLEAGAQVALGEEPTVVQARELFAAIDVSLPEVYSDEDVSHVIDRAVRAKNPYG